MRRSEEKRIAPNVFLNTGVGGLTSFLSAMIFLLIIAVFTSMGKIPEKYMREVTVLACALGSILGSYTASVRQKGKALITGLGSGGVMFVLTILLSALSKSKALMGQLTPAILIAALAGGALGGFLSAVPKRVRR